MQSGGRSSSDALAAIAAAVRRPQAPSRGGHRRRSRRDPRARRTGSTPIPSLRSRNAGASAWVAEVVRAAGYEVEHPAGRLETAVRGRIPGGRAGPGPRIGILAEYDALPGLGHGCGHNTMAASGVGAAIGLAAVAAEPPGEIVFLGTPAEERGSGKQVMIDDGLFDGLDAALLFHPSRRHLRRVPAARLRGRRRHLHRPPGACRLPSRGRAATPSTRW